MKELAVRL